VTSMEKYNYIISMEDMNVKFFNMTINVVRDSHIKW